MKNIDILNKSKIEAINNIKHFLNLINLNPEAFEHLYNIDISIEEFDNREDLATYYHDEDIEEDSNRIAISKNYIEQTNNKLVKEDAIINEVSTSIIHEILHSNRNISICTNEEYFQNLPFAYEEYDSQKDALEEIITETLSIVIKLNKDKKTFNINDTLKELLRYARSNKRIIVEAGYLLLKKYKEKLITSFLLSSYEDIYIDEVVNEISSNEELMNDISDLYYNDTNEKERKILDRINKITNKKR